MSPINSVNTALLTRMVTLGIAIPVLLGIFTYVGFFTNFTTALFNQQSFEEYYLHTSIFRFRILGSHLLLWVYEQIKDWPLADFAPYGLKAVDKNGNANFYYAYFLLNTAFLAATCTTLVVALSKYAQRCNFANVDMPVLFLALLMSFAQFVITPYDTLSYFFLALALIPCCKQQPSWGDHLLLAAVVVLGTLTRETAALILSLYFTVHRQKILSKRITPELVRLLALVALFLLTYCALRWHLGTEDATHKSFRFFRNISNDPLPIVGGLFFLAMLVPFFIDGIGNRHLKVFLLASLPYWLMMFAVAYPWEIRLWVPIFLLMTFIKLTHHHLPNETTP